MGVKKQIFTMELTDAVIQEIIQNGGGEIHISTSEYQDLNSLDTQYWKFHSPYGVPGDELIVLEDYAIREFSQTSHGFFATLEYRDGSTIKKRSRTPLAITPQGNWLRANTMPTFFPRCSLLVQDVQLAVDCSCWIFVTSQLNLPTIDLDWDITSSCRC